MKLIKNKLILIVISIICIGAISMIVYNYKYKVTEESIISDFNENYEKFCGVQTYINENNFEYINIHKNEKKIIISINDEEESYDNLSIKSQIENIIDKLNYKSITQHKGYGEDNFIVFKRKYTDGYEQGIVFVKNNDGKYGTKMTKIRDEWYYYAAGYV